MKDIIRMNQLAGIITEGQAKKMMAILNESKETTNELFGLGGTKVKNGDTVRLVIKGENLIFKIDDMKIMIVQNDTQYDAVKVGEKYFHKGEKITSGESFTAGPIRVPVDKIFLNGTEVKTLTLPSR
jgi:hypothetical protein